MTAVAMDITANQSSNRKRRSPEQIEKALQEEEAMLAAGTSAGGITRRRAEQIDHVWSIDFIFDRTENGRPLRILSLIDGFARECIALEVNRKFTGDDLSDLFTIRGVPEFIRSDNGPESIGRRVRQFLEKINEGTSSMEPGSPWQNGYVESFHGRLTDDHLQRALQQSSVSTGNNGHREGEYDSAGIDATAETL